MNRAFSGHMYFQERAGAPIREYLMNGVKERNLLQKLNELYIRSREI
jgi:multiple sugar transport system substrate-binding protein